MEAWHRERSPRTHTGDSYFLPWSSGLSSPRCPMENSSSSWARGPGTHPSPFMCPKSQHTLHPKAGCPARLTLNPSSKPGGNLIPCQGPRDHGAGVQVARAIGPPPGDRPTALSLPNSICIVNVHPPLTASPGHATLPWPLPPIPEGLPRPLPGMAPALPTCQPSAA